MASSRAPALRSSSRNIPSIRKALPYLFFSELSTAVRFMPWEGVRRGYNKLVVLVPAYKPDPSIWDEMFTRRLRP